MGHLTDRELLELEIKLNPNRKIIYDKILQHAEQQEMEKTADSES